MELEEGDDKKPNKWQTRFHPADSFPAFSSAINTTTYKHSDCPTVEILFFIMRFRTCILEDCKLFTHCISANPAMNICNS